MSSTPLFTYRPAQGHQNKPLVVVLGNRDYLIENILRDVAVVLTFGVRSVKKLNRYTYREVRGLFLTHNYSFTLEDVVNFSNLKLIVRIGCTHDGMDSDAAGEFGIAVSTVPGYGVEETADTTIFLLLSLYRKNCLKILEESEPRLSPLQIYKENFRVRAIRGDTLGIIGFGRTGLAVALRAQAFGMNVIFYDPNVPVGIEVKLGIKRVGNLNDLLAQSDAVTLHCRLTCENRNLINPDNILRMKFGSFLVNASHSGLVDKEALQPYLKVRRIDCASLDIHESEHVSFCKLGPRQAMPVSMSEYLDARSMELRTMAAVEMRRGIIGTIPTSLSSCVNEQCLSRGYGSLFNPPASQGSNTSPVVSSSTDSDDTWISSARSSSMPDLISPSVESQLMPCRAAAAPAPTGAAKLEPDSSRVFPLIWMSESNPRYAQPDVFRITGPGLASDLHGGQGGWHRVENEDGGRGGDTSSDSDSMSEDRPLLQDGHETSPSPAPASAPVRVPAILPALEPRQFRQLPIPFSQRMLPVPIQPIPAPIQLREGPPSAYVVRIPRQYRSDSPAPSSNERYV